MKLDVSFWVSSYEGQQDSSAQMWRVMQKKKKILWANQDITIHSTILVWLIWMTCQRVKFHVYVRPRNEPHFSLAGEDYKKPRKALVA